MDSKIVIILLQYSDVPGLADKSQIQGIQDQAQLMLNRHIQLTYPRQMIRFGRLLMLLSKMQTIHGSVVERLFFRGLLASSSIEKLVGNIVHGDFLWLSARCTRLWVHTTTQRLWVFSVRRFIHFNEQWIGQFLWCGWCSYSAQLLNNFNVFFYLLSVLTKQQHGLPRRMSLSTLQTMYAYIKDFLKN